MKNFKLYMAALLVVGFAGFAFANQGDELAYFPIMSLDTLAVGSIDEAADYVPVYDASAQKMKRALARPDNAGITASAAEINYNDIATLGTLAASKTWTSDASLDTIMPTGGLLTVQSGGAVTLNSGSTLTVAGTLATTGSVTATGSVVNTRTTSADSGTTNNAFKVALTAPVDTTGTNVHVGYDFTPTIGNASGGTNSVVGFNVGNVTGDAQVNVNALKIGTGTTLGTSNAIAIGSGWDAGISDASGITTSGTLTTTGAISVDGVTLNNKALSLPGRATIWICGDATTVNNNTVYYGPSNAVLAGAGRACDITAAGNVTEATADEPPFPATAFQVLSWYCLQPDAGADLTYTLRSAAAGLTPANTLTVLDNALGGTSTTASTTAIASGATFAIAVSSTSNVGTAQFACAVNVAY